MKKPGIIVLIGMVVLIVIINIANFKKKSSQNDVNQAHAGHSHGIPYFESKTINGKVIKASDFKGKNVYIQFVNPRESEDISLFEKVYSNFKDEALELVLFTNDSKMLSNKFEFNRDRVHAFEKDYENYRKVFKSAKNVGAYFLFNGSGEKVDSDKNSIGYEDGPKLKLNELLWNESFNISEFVDHTSNLNTQEWLKQVSNIVRLEKKELYVFYFSLNLCQQCGGGSIIENLKKIHSENEKMIGVTVISYTRFSDQDIDALRSQSGIKFPIVFAEGRLLEKWDSMINRFNRKTMDNIVFTTDQSGKIYSIMFSGCKCFNDFFQTTGKIIKERSK